MKLEIEIDLNDKGKVNAFILFLQACNGSLVERPVETTLEEPIKETPVKKTAKKAVEKVMETLSPVDAVETKVEETEEVETDEKITIEQIREAFATKVNNGDNRLTLKTELSRLGAENLSKLSYYDYEHFLNFINKMQ